MTAALRFWTSVLIAATAAILFAFGASPGADVEADIAGADLQAAAASLVK